MMKLKNLFAMKRFLKKPVVILNIFIHNQVLILKCQFLVLEMTRTYMTTAYFRTMYIDVKISIKVIRRHGGKSTRQLMNLTLERLNNFLKHLLSTVKSIQMRHITFHIKSRRILNHIFRREFVCAGCYDPP